MKELLKKLSAFQNEVPVIHKGTAGYGYKYTDLPKIIETIKPILKKHKLGFYQTMTDNNLNTVIFDVDSGSELKSSVLLPVESLNPIEVVKTDKKGEEKTVYEILGFAGMNKAQAYGSMITYFRRYELTNILGLITSTDSDAINKRIDEKNKPLPTLKKDTNNYINVVKALQGNNATIQQVKTKFTLTKEM